MSPTLPRASRVPRLNAVTRWDNLPIYVGALAMTTPGETSMANVVEVETVMAGGGARGCRYGMRMAFSLDAGEGQCHTGYGKMKMTMHIDEKVLAEVMEVFGFESKTDAVNTALKEMIRKRKLREFMKMDHGLTPEDLSGGLYPGYDPLKLRVAETPADATPGDD